MLTSTAFALALVVVVAAADVAKGPAAAATPPEDAVVWNPGRVTYQVDDSGCHTVQTASVFTDTPAIADTVSAALVADNIKIRDFPADPDIKTVQVNGVQKNGTRVDLTIDGWLSNAACGQATSGSVQQASFATGPGDHQPAATTHVLGTVDLTQQDRIAPVAASAWFKQALKVVAVAAIYVGIAVVTIGAIEVIAAAGGTAVAVTAEAALAGCIGFAAADLIAGRILVPDATATTKSRISVAVKGCIKGAFGALAIISRAGPGIAAGVRRRLNSTPAVVGDTATAVANQTGVDLTGLASMVDGVADGALQASE